MAILHDLGILLTLMLLHASAKTDPCECLNWKELYSPVVVYPDPPPTSWPRLLCGEAHEFTFKEDLPTYFFIDDLQQPDDLPADISDMYYAPHYMNFEEVCSTFFHRMDNNYCVNTGMHEEYGTTGFGEAQWCVVSNECKELNGGKRIPDKMTFYHGPSVLELMKSFRFWREFWNSAVPKNVIPRNVSYKLCTKGKDKRLRDMDPMDLFVLAKSMDSYTGFVAKMAYLRLMPSGPEGKPGGKDWDHVKDFVKQGEIKSMPQPLQDAIAANESIVIDVDPNGHGHQKIIRGKKVYELDNYCTEGKCTAEYWPFKRAKDMGEL